MIYITEQYTQEVKEILESLNLLAEQINADTYIENKYVVFMKTNKHGIKSKMYSDLEADNLFRLYNNIAKSL